MWRTPATRVGLARRRAQPPARVSRRVILALETSCDDTCAAVSTRDGRDSRQRDLLADRHEDFGGVVPEIASRHHLELVNAIVAATRCDRPRDRRSTSVELIAATQGPGPRRRAAGRPLHRQGARGRARAAVRAGRPPAGPRRRELPARRRRTGRGLRAAVRLPDRQRRAHAAGPRRPSTTASRCSGARSTTPPARRSTRARACSASAIPAAPRSSALARGRRPRPRSRFPTRATSGLRQGLDFSFAGLKTALLYKLRELGEAEAAARAADLAASYQAAIVDSLTERAERALRARPASSAWRRRRRRGERAAARAPGGPRGVSCTCRRACSAPTTPR